MRSNKNKNVTLFARGNIVKHPLELVLPPSRKYHDVYQIIGFSWFDLYFTLISGIYKLHQIKAINYKDL